MHTVEYALFLIEPLHDVAWQFALPNPLEYREYHWHGALALYQPQSDVQTKATAAVISFALKALHDALQP